MPPEPQPQVASTPGAPSSRATVKPVKPVIPDHDLVRRIGGGSYGDVWLARNAVGTWRAVKVVFRDRFLDARPYEREFNGIRKFEPLSRSNEAFVDILQIGCNDAQGCFYYVMELADDAGGSLEPEIGLPSDFPPEFYTPKTLAKVLRQRGRLPVAECLDLGLALNLGLAHLHRAGLIHRDIKPSNIIFVRGVPKLADIGLVIETSEARSFVGTEGYIPPEGPTSPQADLFGLGKVLYEAGMGKDRKDFPEPLTGLGEGADAARLLEFNAILLKACAANVAERYPSAEAMNADLALLQSGGSVRRQRKLVGQLRFVQRAGALVTVLAAVISLAWLWQARQTRIVRGLAEERALLAADKTRLADENRERIVSLNVANGVREMDQGDLGRALLWLSDALSLTPADTPYAAMQRIRIQQLLTYHPRLLHIFPHPAPVRAAEFSPDQQRVVTACDDGRIRIWRLEQDAQPAATFALSNSVGEVKFTHDGRRVFAVEVDAWQQPARVSLLDAATGQPLFPPIAGLTSAALSADDRWLAVARLDHRIDLIATASGQVVSQALGHEGRVVMMGFSPDATRLLTASRDRTVRRWDVATGQAVGAPLPHDFPLSRAVFNRDASRIATVTAADASTNPIQFRTWDAATGSELGHPIRGQGLHSLLAYDQSGRHLLTADRQFLARLRDADSRSPILPPLDLDGTGQCVDFSPDGAWVAIGSGRGTVQIWNAETGTRAYAPLRASGRIGSVRFSRDASRLLMASDDGVVKIWDLALAPADRSLRLASPRAAFSPDGRQMAVGVLGPSRVRLVNVPTLRLDHGDLPGATNYHYNGVAVFDAEGRQWACVPGPDRPSGPFAPVSDAPCVAGLWRREAGRIHHFALPHPSWVRSAFFHPNGRRLLTVGADHTSRIWNTTDGSLEQTIRWPESDAAWMSVSPDLSTAIAVSGNQETWRMVLRDVHTGTTLRELPGANPDIRSAAFSPDGSRVALVGADRCGGIWNVRTGERVAAAFPHGGTITWLDWSPDGRRVLTAGTSPEVKVWDAATGEPALPPLRMHIRPVELARFSVDGRFIVGRSDEDFVRVWDAGTGEAITPFLLHRDTVRDVFITADRQLVSAENMSEIRVRNLSETTGSAEDLRDYARLLAGWVLESPGSLAPAATGDLTALLRSLRDRQPAWFASAPQRLLEWHRLMARKTHTLDEVPTALFHLERLARMNPPDATVQSLLEHARTLLIPPRDPALPPRLLDLSRAYTHSFPLIEHGPFVGLPRGRQTLNGTEFDLRGVVHLNFRAERADQVGPFRPLVVVRVGLRCRRLHFLQAKTDDPEVEGSTVARWIVHYADGAKIEWPVLYGEHVRDLWWIPAAEPLEARQATLAWRGRAAIGNLPGTDGVRLFKASWENPRPEVEISRLECRVGDTSMKLMVLAVTAE